MKLQSREIPQQQFKSGDFFQNSSTEMHDSELTYQVVILQNSVMLGKKVYCGESVSSFSRHCWMLRVRSVVFSLSQTGLKSSWLTFFWFVHTAFVLGSSDTNRARFLQF
jgi:hypothetical protein